MSHNRRLRCSACSQALPADDFNNEERFKKPDRTCNACLKASSRQSASAPRHQDPTAETSAMSAETAATKIQALARGRQARADSPAREPLTRKAPVQQEEEETELVYTKPIIPIARQFPPVQRRILYVATALAPGDGESFIFDKWKSFSQCSPHVDIWMLGFTLGSDPAKRGAFKTVWNDKTQAKELVQVSELDAFDVQMTYQFVEDHYIPGNTHFAIGTHGQGTSFFLERITYDGKTVEEQPSMSTRKFDNLVFGGKATRQSIQFLSIVMDCCIMSEAHTANAFSRRTPFIAACEGWMFAPDDDLNCSVLSCFAFDQLAHNPNTYDALKNIQARFTSYANSNAKTLPRSNDGKRNVPWCDIADLSILSTHAAHALIEYMKKQTELINTYLVPWAKGSNTDDPDFCPLCIWAKPPDDDTWDSMWLMDLITLFESVNQHQAENGGDGEQYLEGIELTRAVILSHAGPKESRYRTPMNGLTYSLWDFRNGNPYAVAKADDEDLEEMKEEEALTKPRSHAPVKKAIQQRGVSA